MFVSHGSCQDLHRLRRALFLSPRLNKQPVNQQRIGVLEMIDESFPVVAQLFLCQYTGTDYLVVQNLEYRQQMRASIFAGVGGAYLNLDPDVLDICAA